MFVNVDLGLRSRCTHEHHDAVLRDGRCNHSGRIRIGPPAFGCGNYRFIHPGPRVAVDLILPEFNLTGIVIEAWTKHCLYEDEIAGDRIDRHNRAVHVDFKRRRTRSQTVMTPSFPYLYTACENVA